MRAVEKTREEKRLTFRKKCAKIKRKFPLQKGDCGLNIITLTANPAFDVHCNIERFLPEQENLAALSSVDAGGKGINISRALFESGIKNEAVVVLGEENGAEYLRSATAYGLELHPIFVPGHIRKNITVHAAGRPETRISFRGFTVPSAFSKKLRNTLCSLVKAGDILTVTGRLPYGFRTVDMIKILSDDCFSGVRVVLDSSSFAVCDILTVRPWLIKPNEDEMTAYAGRPLQSISEIKDVAIAWHEKGIENVMVSLGKRGAVLVCNSGCFFAQAPNILPRSTVGAGDSAIAGFLAATTKKQTAAEALCLAAAYGTAACLREGTNPPTVSDIEQILPSVICQNI